jgi:hypothetical protein
MKGVSSGFFEIPEQVNTSLCVQYASIRDGTEEQEGRSNWIGLKISVKLNRSRKGTAEFEGS